LLQISPLMQIADSQTANTSTKKPRIDNVYANSAFVIVSAHTNVPYK
jgi:hypothetical protein